MSVCSHVLQLLRRVQEVTRSRGGCLVVACAATLLFSAPRQAAAEEAAKTVRIMNLPGNKVWYWNDKDQVVSTRLQVDSDSTRFVIKGNSISTMTGKKLNSCKEFNYFPDEQDQQKLADQVISTRPPKRLDAIAKRYPNDINEEQFKFVETDGAFKIKTVGTIVWSKDRDQYLTQCPLFTRSGGSHNVLTTEEKADLEQYSMFMLLDKDVMPNQAAEFELTNNSGTKLVVMKEVWAYKQRFWTGELIQEVPPVTTVNIPAKVGMRLSVWNSATKERITTVSVTKRAVSALIDDDELEAATRRIAARKEFDESARNPQLFAQTLTAPENVFGARWTFKKNAKDGHEGILEGDYGLMQAKQLTFVPISDDATVQITGSGGGKLRTFQEIQFVTPMSLNPEGDDTTQIAKPKEAPNTTDKKDPQEAQKKGKKNISTLKLRANVEIIGDSRTVTLNDVSSFVNSNFTGPKAEGGSYKEVGWYLEKVIIKMTNPSKVWRAPAFGPATTNNQVGYNFTETVGANLDVSKMGPSVGLNASKSEGASANIADYKYVSTYAADGRSPVFTWTLGNVYDGDEKPVTYTDYTSVVKRTSISQAVDRVLDVPPLAKFTFIPTAFAVWTVKLNDVQDDLKCQVDYELHYRHVILSKEQNTHKETGILFAKGLAFFMCKDFYADPSHYLDNTNSSYLSVKLVQKLSVVVTVPKEQITMPYATSQE